MFEIHLDKHFVLPTGNITIPDNKDSKGIGNNNRIFFTSITIERTVRDSTKLHPKRILILKE